jgi:hypothetical protein
MRRGSLQHSHKPFSATLLVSSTCRFSSTIVSQKHRTSPTESNAGSFLQKQRRGVWVSRTTASCSSVRIRFIFYFSNAYKLLFPQALCNDTHTKCPGGGQISISERTSSTRPEARSKSLLPFLITLPRRYRPTLRGGSSVSACASRDTTHELCSKLRNLAPPRTLVRATTYAVRGRRRQILQGGASIALFRTVVFHAASAR